RTETPAQAAPEAGVRTPDPARTPASGATLALPPRDPGAMTGSQFIEATRGLSRAEREQLILRELERGNVPDFARQMRELDVESVDRDGVRHTGKVRVMPDYLAIGSNDDFVRIPMDAITAQRIADRTGTSLPTQRIVDEVWRQADVRLAPQPLPAGREMMSSGYYARHNAMVEAQRAQRGGELGQLTAGHQKDLIIGNRLAEHPDRVFIYGWHQPDGRPIQPPSTVHEATYADYSHGVRLVGGTMLVDGREMAIADVLRDPRLAGLVSHEGVVRNPRVPSA
ncbi:hypothetical protein L6R52_43740, partial [Myxococcota bacterium]|nr:hypothetical protein [Myxococcota bacterium]